MPTGFGHARGSPSFHGHLGIAECLDCGHVWSTTLHGVRDYEKRSIARMYDREDECTNTP